MPECRGRAGSDASLVCRRAGGGLVIEKRGPLARRQLPSRSFRRGDQKLAVKCGRLQVEAFGESLSPGIPDLDDQVGFFPLKLLN